MKKRQPKKVVRVHRLNAEESVINDFISEYEKYAAELHEVINRQNAHIKHLESQLVQAVKAIHQNITTLWNSDRNLEAHVSILRRVANDMCSANGPKFMSQGEDNRLLDWAWYSDQFSFIDNKEDFITAKEVLSEDEIVATVEKNYVSHIKNVLVDVFKKKQDSGEVIRGVEDLLKIAKEVKFPATREQKVDSNIDKYIFQVCSEYFTAQVPQEDTSSIGGATGSNAAQIIALLEGGDEEKARELMVKDREEFEKSLLSVGSSHPDGADIFGG